MSSPVASPPDVGVVIVAARGGRGAGPPRPKQISALQGGPKERGAHRAITSHPEVLHVVVALPPAYAERPPEWLGKLRGERLSLGAGGAQRADSVRAGLAALAPNATVILVHDAARPFVGRGTIDVVIGRARAGVGAVAAVPLNDTVKEVVEEHRITKTVARERLWRAYTPQGFPRTMIEQAYAAWRPDSPAPTDDAEVCECAGFPVEVVTDSPHNVKITTTDDFRLAEALARELR